MPRKRASSPKISKTKAKSNSKNDEDDDKVNNNNNKVVENTISPPVTSTAVRKRKRLVVEEYVEEQQQTVVVEENNTIVAPVLISSTNNEGVYNNSITENSNDINIESKQVELSNNDNDNVVEFISDETVENDDTDNNNKVENVETDNTDTQNRKKHKSNDKDKDKDNKNQQERKIQQKVKPILQNKEYLPHEANIHEKSAAVSYWDKDADIVEITQMRGNFWRTMGFSRDRKCLLYPEEALYLIERGVLLVQTNKISGQRVIFSKFYEEIVQHIQLEVYQAFVKLKTLEYVAFRHKDNVRCFNDDRDVYAYMKENKYSLLDSVVSFDLHLNDHEFSKKGSKERKPIGYVVVLRGDWTFSARLMISLLDEAKGVPIIFAAVMPSGNVLLEEFTDALDSLNWENIYAREIDFRPEESSDEDDDDDDEVDNNKTIIASNTEEKDSNEKSLTIPSDSKNSSNTPKNNNKRKFDDKKIKNEKTPNIINSDSIEDPSKRRRKDDEQEITNDVSSATNNDLNNNTINEEVKTNEENINSNSTVNMMNNDNINIQNRNTSYNMIEKLTDDGINSNDILQTLEALKELMDT